MKSRRPYKGPNKRQKFEYQCNTCKKWFPEKQINVDHIVGAGSLNCSTDLAGFVDRLFCEQDNLQVLCEVCHNEKTQLEKQK
jgi:5-methylcytosine-specific restriction endonuclease McrA